MRERKENIMGKIVIADNTVFEIDEECVKKNPPPKECDIYKYLEQPPNEEKK